MLTVLAAALVYIGALTDSTATLVWGDPAKPGNAIGRAGSGLGPVTIEINGQSIPSSASFLTVPNLQPDTPYPYRILQNGAPILTGNLRTWPRQSQRLVFFVIGDWGTGSKQQYALAAQLESERLRLRAQGDEVRFIFSVGDNIYGPFSQTGKDDSDWIKKFFLPSGFGQRWFHFSIAGLAEFFALDSTRNQLSGAPASVYTAASEQTQWLTTELAKPALPWRFAMQHHPMFTVGPHHPPFLPKATHWSNLFKTNHVRAIFSGHEHNLQFSEQSPATGQMLFGVSGSGGELRTGKVTKRMAERHIAAWAPQRQFLIVELDQETMKITPISHTPLRLTNSNGQPVATPLVVTKSKQP